MCHYGWNFTNWYSFCISMSYTLLYSHSHCFHPKSYQMTFTDVTVFYVTSECWDTGPVTLEPLTPTRPPGHVPRSASRCRTCRSNPRRMTQTCVDSLATWREIKLIDSLSDKLTLGFNFKKWQLHLFKTELTWELVVLWKFEAQLNLSYCLLKRFVFGLPLESILESFASPG